MDTLHFTSVQEITRDIIDIIRHVYQEKPVSINMQEYELFVPEWQRKEVRHRDTITGNNPTCFLESDKVISELESELETILIPSV